jgi:hypothetical protein
MVIGVILITMILAFVLLVRSGSRSSVSTQTANPAANPAKKDEVPKLFPASFNVAAIEKEDQFAGGHAHAIVKLGDLALFIIRDEGGYSSSIERAKAVSDNLNQAMTNLGRDPAAQFRVSDHPDGLTIVQIVSDPADEKELPIVSVTHHDVAGYNRRSHRRVTADELAEWWLKRLADRVALFVRGEAPRLTVADEDGRLLADVYERAVKEAPAGRPMLEALRHALKSLSPEQRSLLSYDGVRIFPDERHDHAKS